MVEAEATFTTTASPERAFDYLADVTQTPRWLQRCVAIDVDGGLPIRKGSKLRYTYKEGRKLGEMQGTVAVHERPGALRFEYRDAFLDVAVSFHIEAAGRGAQVRHDIRIEPRTWIMRLLQPVIRAATRKATARDMKTLNELLDALAAG